MLQIEGMSFPLVLYAGPFVLWIIFFMMGIWYSSHSRKYSLTPAIFVTTIGFIASVIESRYYLSISGSGMGIKFSSFIFSSGIIMLLFSEKVEKLFVENWITRFILFTGEVSFGVYLIHMYVRRAVGYLHINSWVIDWGLTLAITLLIIVAVKRCLSKKLAEKLFGIR